MEEIWNYMELYGRFLDILYLFHSIFIICPLVNTKYGRYGPNHHAKKKWGKTSSVPLAIFHSYVKLPEGEQISV